MPSTFVTPSASVVGNVRILDHSCVWYGAVIRGKLRDQEGGFTTVTLLEFSDYQIGEALDRLELPRCGDSVAASASTSAVRSIHFHINIDLGR